MTRPRWPWIAAAALVVAGGALAVVTVRGRTAPVHVWLREGHLDTAFATRDGAPVEDWESVPALPGPGASGDHVVLRNRSRVLAWLKRVGIAPSWRGEIHVKLRLVRDGRRWFEGFADDGEWPAWADVDPSFAGPWEEASGAFTDWHPYDFAADGTTDWRGGGRRRPWVRVGDAVVVARWDATESRYRIDGTLALTPDGTGYVTVDGATGLRPDPAR